MKTFDLIVIGAGSGLNVAAVGSDAGLKVALIEPGPMGGTCLNRGCIPSKILIHSADVAQIINRSGEYGIRASITGINFKKIINRANNFVDNEAEEIEDAILKDKNTTLFKGNASFIDKNTLKVGNSTIKGKKIVIAAGTRPFVPPIEGIEEVSYLTSKEALRLKKLPKTMTVIGGGFIAAELADFYGGLGTKVVIIQRSEVMLKNEDTIVAKEFTKQFSKTHTVFTNHNTLIVAKKGDGIITTVQPKKGGRKVRIISEQLLLATGRVPNTDVLQVKNAGIKTTKRGYIEANEYMETNVENIWVLGDIAGKYLLKHSANREAATVIQNAIVGKKVKVNYTAMPHAVFSNPQIASVGETQQELDERKAHYAIGHYKYYSTGMGRALEDKSGFCRVYADKKTRKLLGVHILGTDASAIISEAILTMRAGLKVDALIDAIHIHPALSEVVERACKSIQWNE
jgi:mycothione reductase